MHRFSRIGNGGAGKSLGLNSLEKSTLAIIIVFTALLGILLPLVDSSSIDNFYDRIIISGTVLLIYALSNYYPPVSNRIRIFYRFIIYGVTAWNIFTLFINGFSATYFAALLIVYLPVLMSLDNKKEFILFSAFAAALSIAGVFSRDFTLINPYVISGTMVLIPVLFYFLREQAGGFLSGSGSRIFANTMFGEFTDALLLIDPQTGVIVDCNREALELLNADSAEQLYGKPFSSFLNMDSTGEELLKKTSDRNIFENTGRDQHFRTLKNHLFWGNIAMKEAVVRGEKYVLLRVTDITKRKMLDEALSSSEERFRALIENNYDVILVCSIEGRVLYASQSITRCLGYNQFENLSSSIFDIIHPEDLPSMQDHFAKLVAREKDPVFFSARAKDKSGNFKWLQVTASNRIDVKEVGGIVINFTDISEKKSAEANLMESEDKYNFLFDNSPVGVVKYDADFNVLSYNSRFTQILQIKKSADGEIHLKDHLNESFISELKRIFKGDVVNSETSYTERVSGKEMILRIIASPVADSKKKRKIGIAIIEDITDRKHGEIELLRAKEKAEESSRLKSSFLANMSHELRTPMNGILGYSQILRDEMNSPELKNMVENILRSGMRLLGTLNSILDLSLLEAGDMKLFLKEIDFVSYTSFVLKKYQYLAEEKKLGFRVNSCEREVIISIDEKLFNQAIGNLLDNAIKFTNKGHVTVDLDYDDSNAIFRVRDTGIGIAKKDLNFIFDEFRQVSEGYSRRYEGSGLGLPLVKKIVGMMNGKVEVESSTGGGSVFVITLPVSKKSQNNPAVRPSARDTFEIPAAVEGEELPEILIVEDNPVNAEVTIMFLKNLCRVDYAHNANDAMRMVKAKKYKIILMDINLGDEISGIDLTREIKKLREYANVPVVALTGYALAGDRERLLDEGFSDYLSKPIIRNELREHISSLLQKLGYKISR